MSYLILYIQSTAKTPPSQADSKKTLRHKLLIIKYLCKHAKKKLFYFKKDFRFVVSRRIPTSYAKVA